MFKNLLLTVSVGVCVIALGCDSDTPPTAGHEEDRAVADAKEADTHAHTEPGPHGGDLIVLGEEAYHAELLHDEANHSVTVYLQDTDGKTITDVGGAKVELQVFRAGEFVNYPFPGGPEPGMFTLVDESLCDMLLHAADVNGRLKATIAGADYVGIMAHEAHADDGHDHE